MLNFENNSHRRFNPLTGEWILVSPHRTQRPWLGAVETPVPEIMPQYDAECYLCPGNKRAGEFYNPAYQNTFVFENDFSALQQNTETFEKNVKNLLIAESETGICRVVCFSPRHDLTISRMSVVELIQVVGVWREQFIELAGKPEVNSVIIFENRGAMMGASNPHPHGQIWANRSLPNEVLIECRNAEKYFAENNSTLLGDYLRLELELKERIVCETSDFVALVPFWAIYPFETMIISRRAITGFDEFTDLEIESLSKILKELTVRYDNLFTTSFPYSMGFHQRPTDGQKHSYFHFHAHFYPPLLRSANIRKFLVGYELLGMPQRDLTPETAAEKLRAVSAVHYLKKT